VLKEGILNFKYGDRERLRRRFAILIFRERMK
jgi:hypothetical protein